MSAYDTIKPRPAIECPSCLSRLIEFQTKALGCELLCYEEGKSKCRNYSIRSMTNEEIELEKKQYPIMDKLGLLHPYTTDFTKYTILHYPAYQTVCAYDHCSECNRMVYQNFRFNSKGLLKRHKKPFLEE